MLARILSWRLWTLDVQKASEGKRGGGGWRLESGGFRL
jgi:hypothetical protein